MKHKVEMITIALGGSLVTLVCTRYIQAAAGTKPRDDSNSNNRKPFEIKNYSYFLILMYLGLYNDKNSVEVC